MGGITESRVLANSSLVVLVITIGEATCLDRSFGAQFYPVPLTYESRCVRAVTQWPGMPGNDGVAPEMGRVVVASAQRMPDDRPLAASNPFAQQRGLAKACWGGDRGELAVQPRVQPLDQAWTRHQLWPNGGDIELGFQERCGHFIISCLDIYRLTTVTMQ